MPFFVVESDVCVRDCSGNPVIVRNEAMTDCSGKPDPWGTPKESK